MKFHSFQENMDFFLRVCRFLLMLYIGSQSLSLCVVPENIHTPTTEGIGNSEGEGEGGQRPRKIQRGGGLYDQVSFQRDSRGPLIQYRFEC